LAQRGIALDEDGHPTGKTVSAVPQRDYRTPVRFDNLLSGKTSLTWNHYQRGDYDLNGEVNVADLTPVGFHFMKNSGDPDWPAASVADGDGNGEINVADITPIGQNFGAVVAGYVVEAHERADWREYGFAPLDTALVGSTFLELGYGAPAGVIEAEFRVSPVGRTREFAWDTYVLTDSFYDYSTPVLAALDGKPVIAFTSYKDPYSSRLGFGMANTAHPTAASDWQVEGDLLVDYLSHDPPGLSIVQGGPAIAYLEDNGTGADAIYMTRSAATGIWAGHTVASFASSQIGCQLTTRQGNPVILLSDNGLLYMVSAVPQPIAASDWGPIPANPTLTSFFNPDVLASGLLVFACGISGALGENLVFSRSVSPINQPCRFRSTSLRKRIIDIAEPELVGGIPAAVNMRPPTRRCGSSRRAAGRPAPRSPVHA
jgi:hypothetical protein